MTIHQKSAQKWQKSGIHIVTIFFEKIKLGVQIVTQRQCRLIGLIHCVSPFLLIINF